MRKAIDNGNGCICDICKSPLISKKAIKVKFLVLNEDEEKACTGQYQTINKKDLCKKCYDEVCSIVFSERR